METLVVLPAISSATLMIRLGLDNGGSGGTEPRNLFFIWHYAMGAHQPYWAGRPNQGMDQRWANLVEINLTHWSQYDLVAFKHIGKLFDGNPLSHKIDVKKNIQPFGVGSVNHISSPHR
jgi:hypothetical protein